MKLTDFFAVMHDNFPTMPWGLIKKQIEPTYKEESMQSTFEFDVSDLGIRITSSWWPFHDAGISFLYLYFGKHENIFVRFRFLFISGEEAILQEVTFPDETPKEIKDKVINLFGNISRILKK